MVLIYHVLLSHKRYVIIQGCGGYGKTTMIKLFAENEEMKSNKLRFAEVINRRDYYDWSRINNKLNADLSNNVFIIDNFNILSEEDLNCLNNHIYCNRNIKFVLICRKNEVPVVGGNDYAIINCDKYKYNKKQLKKILFSKSEEKMQKSKKVKCVTLREVTPF